MVPGPDSCYICGLFSAKVGTLCFNSHNVQGDDQLTSFAININENKTRSYYSVDADKWLWVYQQSIHL